MKSLQLQKPEFVPFGRKQWLGCLYENVTRVKEIQETRAGGGQLQRLTGGRAQTDDRQAHLILYFNVYKETYAAPNLVTALRSHYHPRTHRASLPEFCSQELCWQLRTLSLGLSSSFSHHPWKTKADFHDFVMDFQRGR